MRSGVAAPYPHGVSVVLLTAHAMWIAVRTPGSHRTARGPLGLEALERFEQYREKCAAEKRQQEEDRAQRAADKKEQRRHEWIVAIVSACCGSVLTLLVERFDVILVCLAQLLGFHVPS